MEQKVHERLDAFVTESGIPRVEIARSLGWSDQKLWRVLKGRTELTAEVVKKIAPLIHRSVAEIYGEDGKAGEAA